MRKFLGKKPRSFMKIVLIANGKNIATTVALPCAQKMENTDIAVRAKKFLKK